MVLLRITKAPSTKPNSLLRDPHALPFKKYMKSLPLVLRILAIVAAVAAAVLFFLTKGKLAEKQAELDSTRAVSVAVQAKLETANNKVTSTEKRLSNESEALAESKRSLESTRTEASVSRREVSRTQQQLRQVKKETEALEDTAKDLRTDLVSVEKNLATASKEADLAQLNERVKELEQANRNLTTALKAERATKAADAQTAPSSNFSHNSTAFSSTMPSVSDYQVNTTPAVQSATIGVETTIASVSIADGLIILNTTPELGLTPGTSVTLVKELTAIAKIQVFENQGDYAIANILPGAKSRKLTAGLTVKILR